VKYVRFLKDLYGTQIALLWHWRLGRRALLRRAVLSLIISVVALGLTAWLLPQLQIHDIWAGLAAVLFLAAFNLLIRPVLLTLVAGRSVILLAILTIVIQAAAIMLLDPIIPGVDVTGGVLSALLVSFVFGFILAAISTAIGLGEDESYYGALVRSLVGRGADVQRTDEPGVVIIQIDGLSHDVASHAMRAGRIPVMSGWIRSGTHRLSHWDALLPARRPRARRASSTGPTTASPTSAGGRRRHAGCWWPTTRTTRPSSRAGCPTGKAFSARAERASATSSRAMRTARSWSCPPSRCLSVAWARARRSRGSSSAPTTTSRCSRATSPRSSRRTSSRDGRRAPASCPGCTAGSPTRGCARRPTSRCGRWVPRSSSRRCCGGRP